MTELRPGLTFSIINKELDLAWDLLHEDKTFIVGARPNGKSSQKWKAEKVHGHWVIVNASNQEYANVDHVEPLRPGVRLVTSKSPRNWEARFDPEFDGLRIIIPDSRLNAEIALLGHPLPEIPVTLGEELPRKNQIWELKEEE